MQFEPEIRKKLEDKFFKDPDWHLVRQALHAEIVRLEGLAAINVTLPAEDVKCQVKGHKVAQEILLDFFMSCGMIASDSQMSPGETDFR
jgi:hypothetical protein